MTIKAVIFDWAGTTVDFGSYAPVAVFLEAFKDAGIAVTDAEVRQPMGMLKIDHIRTMLKMERIAAEWKAVHGTDWTESDVKAIYNNFETQLFATLRHYATPIDGVVEAVAALRAADVKIGSTTGYTRAMIDIVKTEAAALGYAPDWISTADEVDGFGRPAPFMVFDNMRNLQLTDVREVVKVGDTEADIREGQQAGVRTIGVLIGSSMMGLTEEAYAALTPAEQQQAITETREKYEALGVDATVRTMSELPDVIAQW